MKRMFLPLMLATTIFATPALAAYSVNSPPAGWIGPKSEWATLVREAQASAKSASKLVKGANIDCLIAVFVKMKLDLQVAHALDTRTGPNDPKNIDSTKAKQVRENAKSERDDSCNDSGSGGATVEAMAKYVESNPDMYERLRVRDELASLYSYAKPTVAPDSMWAEYLIKAGILVRSGAARAVAASGILMGAIVDPRAIDVLSQHKVNPQDGI